GSAPGLPRAAVPPPLDAIPLALPSAVREVARSPARHPEAAPLAGLGARLRWPAAVAPVADLEMASVVALHPAADSVAAGLASGHLAGPAVAGLGVAPVAAGEFAVAATVAVDAVTDARVPDCNARPVAADQHPGYHDNRS